MDGWQGGDFRAVQWKYVAKALRGTTKKRGGRAPIAHDVSAAPLHPVHNFLERWPKRPLCKDCPRLAVAAMETALPLIHRGGDIRGMNAPPNISLAAGFDLATSSHWRRALAVLFALAVLGRWLVLADIGGEPVGMLHESAGTEPWFYHGLATEVAGAGDWLMQRQNLLLTPEMLARLPMEEWYQLGGMRAPRGAMAVYLMAAGMALGHGLMLFRLAAMVAAGLLAVMVAMIGARAFGDRRAGFLAGLLAATHQASATAAVLVGPWIFEATAFAAIVLGVLMAREPGRAAWGWLLLGGAVATGIWLRPVFLWGFAAIAWAFVAGGPRPDWRAVAVALAMVAGSVGALAARNSAVGAPVVPVVGHAGWEFARTVHPQAIHGEIVPPDLALWQASGGGFLRAVQLSLGQEEYRAAIPGVLSFKLRRMLGARDAAGTVNYDYLRRRSEALRLTTMAPDTMMALLWASVLWLLYRRRLPRIPALAAGFAVVVALFGSTAGGERIMLHVAGAVLIGGAFLDAWDRRRAAPAEPFLFLALWLAAHVMLQVDDQARESRFREQDFVRSALMYRRLGQPEGFERERADYTNLRETERVLRGFWNAER